MSETTTVPALPDEPPADSLVSRAMGVFVSPARTFESIVRRPDFLAPLIAGIVGSIVIAEAMLAKIGAGRIVRHAIELSGKGSQMAPEQVDQAVQRAAGFTAVAIRVGGIVGVPIFILVIAAVGLFIVNVMFGASANFKVCFSVVCYANLVLLVAVALGLVMILLGAPEQFNPDNFVPTTVGFFLDPRETSRPLYAIAGSFDIFRVWFIVLSSLGLSTATQKKVRTAPVLLTYMGIWVLLVLGKAGWAAMMG